MAGGLNLSQQQVRLQPGELVGGQNVEISIGGGYRRTDGYERFDGHPVTPSNNTYQVITFAGAGPRELQANDNVVGPVGAAVVCGAAAIASGAFASNDAAGTLGITLITGGFNVGERVLINGVYAFTVTALAEPASIDDGNFDEWVRGAANAARSRIGLVPGSGPVRGVVPFNGSTYAFRDNAAGTAGDMWKATATGWTRLALDNQLIGFDTGILVIPDYAGGYATVTGLTSGATAAVVRVALRSGVWGTNAAGVLAVQGVTGTFVLGETLRVAGTARATVTAVPIGVALPPGGRYEFEQWNFYGSTDTKRLYGVNGVGAGFEFDDHHGQYTFIPIKTGMVSDIPEHVAVHKNYLFFTFKSSVQNGGAGEPHAWTARLGAQEFGVGEQVTAIRSVRQDVLGIATTNSIHLLYGSSALDWSLKKLSREIGCSVGCMTEIPGGTAVHDTNGVLNISAVQSFGDFQTDTMTQKIDLALRAQGSPIGMVTQRNLSQLRLFFDNGNAFYATYGGVNRMGGMAISGWTQIVHAHSFFCIATGEDASGQEVQYAGGIDGYVYQLNTGNSFDGMAIESLLRLPYFHYGTPERKKRFRKIVLEMDSPSALNLEWATDFNYGDAQYGMHNPVFTPNNGGLYDEGVFGQFIYDAGFLTAPLANIAGVGKNMSLLIRQSSDIARPWSIQAAHIHFSPWGIQR